MLNRFSNTSINKFWSRNTSCSGRLVCNVISFVTLQRIPSMTASICPINSETLCQPPQSSHSSIFWMVVIVAEKRNRRSSCSLIVFSFSSSIFSETFPFGTYFCKNSVYPQITVRGVRISWANAALIFRCSSCCFHWSFLLFSNMARICSISWQRLPISSWLCQIISWL